jgi:GT2 family glycosyltransferase
LIPSRSAISRCETPSAANARTCAHSNALRTSAPSLDTTDRASLQSGPDAISGLASGALSLADPGAVLGCAHQLRSAIDCEARAPAASVLRLILGGDVAPPAVRTGRATRYAPLVSEYALESPLVSVIVPTRNSAASIVQCLQSIRAQTHTRLELVVVDNRSTDPTPELAASFADRVLAIGPERSAQRNAGARDSSGGYLLFVDSDMSLEQDVVRQCVEAVSIDPARTVVVIPEISVGEGFWARCKALERSCYVGDDTIEAARFLPRELFFELNGFDETLPAGPEDWDLHERARLAGARVSRTSSYIRHHEGDLRLGYTLGKKFHYGGSMSTYMHRHPELARSQLRLIRPAFVREWPTLAAAPGIAAGMLLMKSLEFAAGAAGLATATVRRRLRRDAYLQGIPRQDR